MKKIIKKLWQNIGEILIIVGSGIFIYNVFSFSYDVYTPTGKIQTGKIQTGRIGVEKELLRGVAYYYSSTTLKWITAGVILFVLGILIIKRQKNEK